MSEHDLHDYMMGRIKMPEQNSKDYMIDRINNALKKILLILQSCNHVRIVGKVNTSAGSVRGLV